MADTSSTSLAVEGQSTGSVKQVRLLVKGSVIKLERKCIVAVGIADAGDYCVAVGELIQSL